MRYLLDHLDHLRSWAVVAVVAPAWQWVRMHWAGFWWSSPVVWIGVFWGLDWITGSINAIRDGLSHPEDPRRGWRVARAAWSVGKLLLWLCVLAVAWGLRDSGIWGGGLCASCLEAGVLLTEASSVIRNCARLSDSPVARRVLTIYADRFEDRASGRILIRHKNGGIE